jgi:hypothetical protein
MMVSLDHSIYFHNPRAFRADEWMLSEIELFMIYLLWARGPIQRPFQTAPQFCSLLFLQLPQTIVHDIPRFSSPAELEKLLNALKNPSDLDDEDITEITVGDIGKSRQVCLVTTFFGDCAAGTNVPSDLLESRKAGILNRTSLVGNSMLCMC